MKPVAHITRLAVAAADTATAQWQDDCVIVETPVALVYNGISHAVMMATPTHLHDFALGFSFSEGIIESATELYEVEQLDDERGLILQLRISARREAALKLTRKRTGVTSCGICGMESLAEVSLSEHQVRAPRVTDRAIQRASAALHEFQPLQEATGASHAAAWCRLDGEIVLAREDAGRHNALDKMIGAVVSQQLEVTEGFALVSSRASFEMVQKSCRVGIGALVAVSAPTSLAIAQARQAGQLLVGFARPGRHVIYHLPFGEDSSESLER